MAMNDNIANRPENSFHHHKLSGKLLGTIPPRLMSDTVREIYDAFTFFDLNANQSIESNELRRVFNALNIKKNDDECQEMINDYDLNENHLIDFHEFIFALARHVKHDVFTLTDIQQRFNKFDEDQDGKLTVAILPTLIRKGFGILVSDREIFDLLATFEITDDTARITFGKLIRMLQYAVREGEKSQAPEYMRKLNHRCGPAVRNLNGNDLRLLKKRLDTLPSTTSIGEENK